MANKIIPYISHNPKPISVTIKLNFPFVLTKAFFFFLLTLALSSCSLFRPASSSSAGKSEEDGFRSEVVNYAEQFVGTPYKYAGTSPQSGFDCSGFTSYVMSNFKINLSHSSSEQEKQGKKIKIDEVQPGDLIFYRRSAMGKVFHVSLVVSNDRNGITVVHSVSRGVVVENITTSSYWKPKISSARNVISK